MPRIKLLLLVFLWYGRVAGDATFRFEEGDIYDSHLVTAFAEIDTQDLLYIAPASDACVCELAPHAI